MPPPGGHRKECRFKGILYWLHFSGLKATCIDLLIQAYWWFWIGPRCECECQFLARCVGPTTCPGVPRLLGSWDRLQRPNDKDKQKKTDGWMEARVLERRAHPLVWTWWISSSLWNSGPTLYRWGTLESWFDLAFDPISLVVGGVSKSVGQGPVHQFFLQNF